MCGMTVTRADMTHALVDALRQTGQLALPPDGSSMGARFERVEAFIVRAIPPMRPRPGDIVVFRAADALVAHRLIRRTADGWITKGDATLRADARVKPDEMVGVVTGIRYRDGREVACFGVWSRICGMARAFALPLLRVRGRLLRRR